MTITELKAKVDAATGPSRELDYAIWAALCPDSMVVPADVSASIDAAVALVEQVLPGCTRDVDATAPELGIDVTLYPRNTTKHFRGTNEREPLATISALLAARIAMEGEQ